MKDTIIKLKDNIIDCEKVLAVTLAERNVYIGNNRGTTLQPTVVVFYGQFPIDIPFNNMEDAQALMEKILDKMNHEQVYQPTYLDGFKEGTEYALKLMEVKV